MSIYTRATLLKRVTASAVQSSSTTVISLRSGFHTRSVEYNLLASLANRFKMLRPSTRAKKPVAVEDEAAVKRLQTKDIKSVESQLKNREEQQALVEEAQAARELEVLGMPAYDTVESWEAESNGFKIVPFPINLQNEKLDDLDLVKGAIFRAATAHGLFPANATAPPEGEQWLSDIVFDDIKTRFLVFKQIQRELDIQIPDPELSRIGSAEMLFEYFLDKVHGVKRFNPKEPNAIYLDPQEFIGTNITLKNGGLSDAEVRKLKKQRWRELVKEAKSKQEQELKSALNN